MEIKYGDLPPRSLCEKLISVSFSTPKKNLSVYKFCMAALQHLNYIENEKIKLFQKYGEADKNNPSIYCIQKGTGKEKQFQKEWEEMVNMELDEELSFLCLKEQDFMDENCQYSPDKSKWLNASEIATVLKFCK